MDANNSNSFTDRLQQAKEQLLKYPGVVFVTQGYKETGPMLTDTHCLRVYVSHKLKNEEIPAEHLVPSEINGFKTDVIEQYAARNASKGGTRPLVGGLSILEYDDIQPKSGGTMGCVAKRKTGSQFVILSCAHVLNTNGTVVKPENNAKHIVRQPSRKDCCGFYYENIVGPIVIGTQDQVDYKGNALWIDAAIANINGDVHTTNDIDKIGTVQGTEDATQYFTTPIPANYAVRKMGATTGYTEGIMVEVDHNDPGSEATHPPWLKTMMIRPQGKIFTKKVHYAVDPANKAAIKATFASNEPLVTVTEDGNNLVFTTKTFVDHGDSGAVVVNAQNKVIGVLFAVTERKVDIILDGRADIAFVNTGRGYVCHIGPVMATLDININSGTVQTAGEPMLLEEIEMEQAEQAPDLKDAMLLAEKDLLTTVVGPDLINAFRRHGEELVRLIHHYRPVKIAWHRNYGPSFSVSMINMVRDHSKHLHREIKGISIVDAALRLRDALYAIASPDLKSCLQYYEPAVLQILENCNRYDQILNELSALR